MSLDNDKLLQQMVTLIQQENKKQTEDIRSGFQSDISEIKLDITEIKAVIQQEKINTKGLSEQNKIILDRLASVERVQRRNNIVIFGLEIKSENLVRYTIEQLNRLLHLNLSVNNINNIRLIGDPQKLRPIVVEFVSFLTKLEVFRNCKKLKGTRITISDDLNKYDREIRKRLLVHQREARNNNLRSYIKGNKLVVNDEIYTIEELELNVKECDVIGEEGRVVEEDPKRATASAPLKPIPTEKQPEQEEYNLELQTDDPRLVKKKKIAQVDLHKTRPTTRNFNQQIPGGSPKPSGSDILSEKNLASNKFKKLIESSTKKN